MADYSEIDRRIVDAVASGKTHFYLICAACGISDSRVIDRRLQSLRKRGVLHYQSQRAGWKLA